MYENFGNFLLIIFTMKISSFLRKNGLEYGITSETTETREPRVRRRKPGTLQTFQSGGKPCLSRSNPWLACLFPAKSLVGATWSLAGSPDPDRNQSLRFILIYWIHEIRMNLRIWSPSGTEHLARFQADPTVDPAWIQHPFFEGQYSSW